MRYITADEIQALILYHKRAGNKELVKVYREEYNKLQAYHNRD